MLADAEWGGVKRHAMPTKTMYPWLHGGYMNPRDKKAPTRIEAKSLICMGWLMGLEPTTTGITILDSTN